MYINHHARKTNEPIPNMHKRTCMQNTHTHIFKAQANLLPPITVLPAWRISFCNPPTVGTLILYFQSTRPPHYIGHEHINSAALTSHGCLKPVKGRESVMGRTVLSPRDFCPAPEGRGGLTVSDSKVTVVIAHC